MLTFVRCTYQVTVVTKAAGEPQLRWMSEEASILTMTALTMAILALAILALAILALATRLNYTCHGCTYYGYTYYGSWARTRDPMTPATSQP